jgi:hypothetical protein
MNTSFWKEFDRNREKTLNINEYINDGFEKVCDVTKYGVDWMYKNINKDLMYSDHNSWVYFIVENETIVKCGETGNPLGIPEQRGYLWEYPIQPVGNSKSRFGRLRKGDGTDAFIRAGLRKSINSGNIVSLWAKKCKIHTLAESLQGQTRRVETTIHKSVELMYLEHFKSNAGHLPLLNKSLK